GGDMVTRSSTLEGLAQDLRYTLRGIRRAPGFAATVVLILALGVGAHASMFSVLDRLLLRAPPGVQHPEQLRRVYAWVSRTGTPFDFEANFSIPDFEEMKAGVAGLAEISA